MIDPRDEASRDRLSRALAVRRWVDEVAEGGPYESVEALVAAGDRAAETLTGPEIDEAARGSRAGEQAGGDGTTERRAADDQAGLGAGEAGQDAAIARGGEVYEQRFGRAFLISTTGRDPQEVLDELQRRLKNDPEAEDAEVREQLRLIAGLRLRDSFQGTA